MPRHSDSAAGDGGNTLIAQFFNMKANVKSCLAAWQSRCPAGFSGCVNIRLNLQPQPSTKYIHGL